MRWLIVLLAPLLLAATCAESGSSNNPPVPSGGAVQQAVPTSAVAQAPLAQVGAHPPVDSVSGGKVPNDAPISGNLLCTRSTLDKLEERSLIEALAAYQVCSGFGRNVLELTSIQTFASSGDPYNATVRVDFIQQGCGADCPIKTSAVVAFRRILNGDWNEGRIVESDTTTARGVSSHLNW